MPRHGRPKKAGLRDKRGRLVKTQQETLNELTARERAETLATVLGQPHRRGSDDPKLGYPLGRFVVAHKLRDELLAAGDEYGSLYRRWALAKGLPGFAADGGGMQQFEASREQLDIWESRIMKCESAMRCGAIRSPEAIKSLVVSNVDIDPALSGVAIAGLLGLAVYLDPSHKGFHPFK